VKPIALDTARARRPNGPCAHAWKEITTTTPCKFFFPRMVAWRGGLQPGRRSTFFVSLAQLLCRIPSFAQKIALFYHRQPASTTQRTCGARPGTDCPDCRSSKIPPMPYICPKTVDFADGPVSEGAVAGPRPQGTFIVTTSDSSDQGFANRIYGRARKRFLAVLLAPGNAAEKNPGDRRWPEPRGHPHGRESIS